MLEVNREKLQEDLMLTRRFLDEVPDSTKNLERVARCLYWLGEPEASSYLTAIAHAYDVLEEDLEETQRLLVASRLHAAGHYFRLAGEPEEAHRRFTRALALLELTLEHSHRAAVLRIIELYFLLERYEEAYRLTETLEQTKNFEPRLSIAGRLACARSRDDAIQASEIVLDLEGIIRKDWSITPSATGGFDYWTWYEIALKTKAELEDEKQQEIPGLSRD